MTSRSNHDEDMSMEEILASIRRFVTDEPSGQAVRPIQQPGVEGNTMKGATGSQPVEAPQVSFEKQPIASQHQYPENEMLELGRSSEAPVITPVSPIQNVEQAVGSSGRTEKFDSPVSSLKKQYSGEARIPSSSFLSRQGFDDSILTLTNPIDSDKQTKPVPQPAKTPSPDSDTIGSSQTVVSSAGSLARLAQTAKSVVPGNNGSPGSTPPRNMTLDQLIQDMIRPMIKQWIDTHLPSLVEDMVAREIKRITQHLD
jgi:cell pole-organizing protein PopZ